MRARSRSVSRRARGKSTRRRSERWSAWRGEPSGGGHSARGARPALQAAACVISALRGVQRREPRRRRRRGRRRRIGGGGVCGGGEGGGLGSSAERVNPGPAKAPDDEMPVLDAPSPAPAPALSPALSHMAPAPSPHDQASLPLQGHPGKSDRHAFLPVQGLARPSSCWWRRGLCRGFAALALGEWTVRLINSFTLL